jgi:glutaredoxin
MGNRPMQIILYTRARCCLCDQAKEILEKHGLAVQEVDIDADSALQRQYDQFVPVVEIDGKERFWGRIDETLLRRLLNVKR